MGLLGAGGGDDRLQIQLAVFGVIVSIMVSALLPVLVPVSATGYSLDDIYAERSSLEMYTGESMINQAPYKLQHVYTPYTVGQEYHLTEEGWLYGTELTDADGNPSYTLDGTEYIGETEIRLDPAKKSSTPLYQGDDVGTGKVKISTGPTGDIWQDIANGFLRLISFGTWGDTDTVEDGEYPVWNFSGYRYELDPMLRIATHNADGDTITDTKTVDDAKLSIVWYDVNGQEGISGGLVLYNSKTNAVLASYTAAEIVAQYNSLSQNASKFKLDFDGTLVTMWIRFDPDVLINNLDLSQSFSLGRWTVAFTSSSADTYLDLQNSNSFSSSLGSMLETYIGIMTLDIPSLSTEWNLVLWIICVMPTGLAMILFLSRFGLAGLGAGILGMAFAGGVLL